ncbi:hypothetical protein GOP47_0014349 [Adiantum capillus-veneris]|uniref:Cyanate hydratase n=1 Tax=Adiantum capillus-veneris TaxID=13818 RepID=A0A9D4UM48_ADICA|nr:hypothetical protein GOP47_0014349 [Adiantum capillus-veneris]
MAEEKAMLVKTLLRAKERTGKTFTQIATEVGITNAYAAQLFHRQAPLPESLVESLQRAVPTLSSELLQAMKVIPLRSYDPNILQDPTIYRFNEATAHYAESIKAIINEEFGDGIMSAIGFYCTVEKVKGKDGEDRVAVVFNGKFLPHVVQQAEDNTVKLQSTNILLTCTLLGVRAPFNSTSPWHIWVFLGASAAWLASYHISSNKDGSSDNQL